MKKIFFKSLYHAQVFKTLASTQQIYFDEKLNGFKILIQIFTFLSGKVANKNYITEI